MTSTRLERATAPTSIFSPALRAVSGGILVLVTLIAFEGLAVAAALPTVARELHGVGSIGWAFTALLVSNVVGMVISGQISDRHGPARPLVAGLVAFVAGLVVSGTAGSMVQLVAGRAAQGLGSGLLVTAIYVVIGEAYPDALRSKIFAAMSSAWVMPALIGPVIAGTLAEKASWRWVFLGLLPFVLIGAALLVPALRRLTTSGTDPSRLADPRRVVAAFATAGGVAAMAAAGQHPAPATLAAGVVGVVALVFGLRYLLPAGTATVQRGVSAPIAMRGLLAGAFFGVDALIPLTLTIQHGYGPIEAGLPLVSSGVTWALGSWWQGRDQYETSTRVGLIRAGFVLVAVGAVVAAIAAQPSAPGWLMYLAWALAGAGAGFAMSSVGVLLLRFTTDDDRGADSAAMQLSDAVAAAITSGVGGVLVAAAARGVLGYTAAFSTLDLALGGVAALGAVLAGRARPLSTAPPLRPT